MYCISPSLGVGDGSKTNGLGGNRHPPQKFQRAALVQVLVEVAALRALHAGGAAALARAALEHAGRVLDPALEGVEAALGDPDAAGMAVVDEDGRAAGLEVHIGGEAAD